MGAGSGFIDARGIYQYGEDDAETLISDLLNTGQQSVSDALVLDRARLTALEALTPGVVAAATNFSVNASTSLVRDRNGIVTLNLYVVRTSGTMTVNEALVTLPAGFRPAVSDSIVGTGFAFGGVVAAGIRIYPNGNVLYIGPTGNNTLIASVSFKA